MVTVEHLAEKDTPRKSARMRLGTFIVRCGLRIAYGPRDNYAEVTLSRRTRPLPPGSDQAAQ